MDKIQRLERLLKQLRSVYGLRTTVLRTYSTDKDSTEESTPTHDTTEFVEKPKLSGFAESFERFSHIGTEEKKKELKTFAYLVRHSKLVDLGDPENKIVNGKVFHVVGDDLYIDFGWKFHCVCTRPKKNASLYVRGAIVRLKVQELELSTRFLGATKDLTVLEADCILLGLISSPLKATTTS